MSAISSHCFYPSGKAVSLNPLQVYKRPCNGSRESEMESKLLHRLCACLSKGSPLGASLNKACEPDVYSLHR